MWNGMTFLRRPEVPGFCPSKGVVWMRETLKSTIVTWSEKKEIEEFEIWEREEEDAREVVVIYLYRKKKREGEEGKKGEEDECTLLECDEKDSGRKYKICDYVCAKGNLKALSIAAFGTL